MIFWAILWPLFDSQNISELVHNFVPLKVVYKGILFNLILSNFLILLNWQGIFAIGVFTNAFVWAMEIVGGKWQTIIGIGCEGPWVVCWFTLALLAYIFPNWRHLGCYSVMS